MTPVSSVAGICCFVGSETFRWNEADATKAYLLKNPDWPGTLGIALFHASGPLREGMSPDKACTLACLDHIGQHLRNHTVVVQTMTIRNGAASGDAIPVCFATLLGPGDETKVVLLDEDPIPYQPGR